MLVTVEDGRAELIRGDGDDPVTRGFICERTNRFLDRQYATDRLLRPMMRRNGTLEAISWESALDLAAEKLEAAKREFGPASILHYRSGGSLGMLKWVAEALFARFGPVTTKHGDICSGAGEAAQLADFGICESHDFFDLEHSEAILLWGKNPHTSNVHLLPMLKEAKARGATLLGIDPVRTKIASSCDAFLQPRPGHDHAVALGMARWLFENDRVDDEAETYCENFAEFRRVAFENDVAGWARIAEVESAALADFSARYAAGNPAAIQVGWGLGRRRNGSRTVRAIDALAAVSGNLGRPGGGVSFYYGRRDAFDTGFGTDDIKPRANFRRVARRFRGPGRRRSSDPRDLGDRGQPGHHVAR